MEQYFMVIPIKEFGDTWDYDNSVCCDDMGEAVALAAEFCTEANEYLKAVVLQHINTAIRPPPEKVKWLRTWDEPKDPEHKPKHNGRANSHKVHRERINKRWTRSEDSLLRQMYKEGCDRLTIANALHRSRKSIYARLNHMREAGEIK